VARTTVQRLREREKRFELQGKKERKLKKIARKEVLLPLEPELKKALQIYQVCRKKEIFVVRSIAVRPTNNGGGEKKE